jgi:ribosomal protein S21
MAVESKRKQNEPLNVFLRRFTEQVKRSGVINEYKNKQFYTKEKSQELKKKNALQKKKRGEKLSFLRKAGKVK